MGEAGEAAEVDVDGRDQIDQTGWPASPSAVHTASLGELDGEPGRENGALEQVDPPSLESEALEDQGQVYAVRGRPKRSPGPPVDRVGGRRKLVRRWHVKTTRPWIASEGWTIKATLRPGQISCPL